MNNEYTVLKKWIDDNLLIGVPENITSEKLIHILKRIIEVGDFISDNYIQLYRNEDEFKELHDNGLGDKIYYNSEKKTLRIGLQDADGYDEFILSNNVEFDGSTAGIVPVGEKTGTKFLCDTGEWKEITSSEITDLPNNDINLF